MSFADDVCRVTGKYLQSGAGTYHHSNILGVFTYYFLIYRDGFGIKKIFGSFDLHFYFLKLHKHSYHKEKKVLQDNWQTNLAKVLALPAYSLKIVYIES